MTHRSLMLDFWYKQAFNDEWLTVTDPALSLKDWMKPNNSSQCAVMCTVSSTTLANVNKTGLLAHRNTNKHMRNSRI